MNVVNDLLNYKGLKIVQNTQMFCFSLDSVLLSNFVEIKDTTTNILDIGTGNAPIPLILSTKTTAKILGVEIQKQSAELAKKSVSMNNLKNQIEIIHEDVNNYYLKLQSESIDVITCNPPYFEVEKESNLNKNEYKTIARHEVTLKLLDIMKIVSRLLKNNGDFYMVHRPDRLVEILATMEKFKITPKTIRFIYSNLNKDSTMVLIKGVKNGKKNLKVLKPLVTHNKDGYSAEVLEMFGDYNVTKKL